MTAKFYFIAGEKSGDLHGGCLMAAMRKIDPNFEAKGIGGKDMQAQGLIPEAPFEAFNVMGFSDVLLSLFPLVSHFYSIGKKILAENPTAVIFIDYPEFNLRLAKYLKKKGYQGKLIHYIAPTVWAWKKKRAKEMAKTHDLLLTIYPFEVGFFPGLKTIYVGNPLMKGVSSEFHKETPILALFPGSRPKEIARNLPLQLKAAEFYLKQFPETEIAISTNQPIQAPFPFTIIPESNRFDLMQKAKAALAKSGTVTLELALRGCPTVVQYPLTRLNYFLAKYVFKIQLPYYSLPNILLNTSIFEERYQIDIDPKDLASALAKTDRQKTQAKALELQTLLSTKNASSEAAKEIFQLC